MLRVTVIAIGFDEAREHAQKPVVERQKVTYLNQAAEDTSGEPAFAKQKNDHLEEPPITVEAEPRVAPPRRKVAVHTWRTNRLQADDDAYDIPAFLRYRKPD